MLLVGVVIHSIGDGMLITALPVLTLRINGSLNPALAIAVVGISPFMLSGVFAFTAGLTKLRPPLRSILLCDSALRAATFLALGGLAATGALTLPVLVLSLVGGSALRLMAMSGERLVAASMVPESGRLAVNGLLALASNLSLFVIGPAIGGILAAAAGPGWAILFDGLGYVILLVIVALIVPRVRTSADPATSGMSGWHAMRRTPVAARLFAITFLFNFFYMPVEVALPLLTRDSLHATPGILGLLWSALGLGSLLGGVATNWLRRMPHRMLVVGVIGAWGGCVVVLAAAPSVPIAMLACAVGGFVYAPFTPIVYTFVQSLFEPAEHQPIVTLWTAGSTIAMPIGLLAAGPMVALAGPRAALGISAVLTIALAPLAAFGLRVAPRPSRLTGATHPGPRPDNTAPEEVHPR